MRAPISVIVPTLNAEKNLPGCLSALVAGLEASLIRELIVCDGGSTDETIRIAEAWGATVLSGPPSRGGQLKRGCEAASGEWLMILHADTELAPGWTGPVAKHLKTEQAGWFQLRFDAGGRVVSDWANLRARLGLPYGDQGLVLPRTLYEKVGGYRDVPLMEDVGIVRALRGALRPIDAVALTSAEKYRRKGWVVQGTRNLWFLARYFTGASPEKLAASYYRVSR